MERTDIEHLQKRLSALHKILKEQHSIKKTERNQRLIDQTKKSIDTINQWMDPPVAETVKEKSFTKEEFLQYMRGLGLDTKNPGAVMTIDTKKQIDQMWPWLRTANIEIRIRHDLVEYFKNKMDEETNRPYKAITK